jgi:hypothetical protein
LLLIELRLPFKKGRRVTQSATRQPSLFLQDNLPLILQQGFLEGSCYAAQKVLRQVLRRHGRVFSHRQVKGKAPCPSAGRIHVCFMMPSQAIVVVRGTGDVLGRKPWQSRSKKKTQGSGKHIHLAVRFRYARSGAGLEELLA